MEYDVFNQWLALFWGEPIGPTSPASRSPSRSFHPESPAGGACRRRPETMMNYMNYMNYQDPYGKGYIDPLIDLLYELSIHSPFPISAFHTSVVSIVNLRSISFLVALPIGAAGKGHSSESLQKSITKQSIRHDCTVDRGGHDQSHQPRPQSVAHDVNVMELNWHQQEPPHAYSESRRCWTSWCPKTVSRPIKPTNLALQQLLSAFHSAAGPHQQHGGSCWRGRWLL